MNTQQIEKLVKELCKKEITYKDYEGKNSSANLVRIGNDTIVEQIIRQHLLDNRDEKLGILEAKVFVYEEMIAKSTFAPMLVVKEEPIKPFEETSFRREMIFTQRQIENLFQKVYVFTGEGEITKLFKEILCLP